MQRRFEFRKVDVNADANDDVDANNIMVSSVEKNKFGNVLL